MQLCQQKNVGQGEGEPFLLKNQGHWNSLEQEDAQTKPEMLSSSSKGQLEQPCEKEILKGDDNDDNVPIYKLLNKTPLSSRVNTPAVKNMKGVRCAERGMSAMLLWQHEFVFTESMFLYW